MTDQEINIAIAEICGWKYIRPLGPHENNRFTCFTNDPNGYPPDRFTEETLVGLHPENGEGALLSDVPDYCNDLNAMHDAEKVLSVDQRSVYCYHLLPSQEQTFDREDVWCGSHATPAQRARAFLETFGKWTS